MKEEALKHAERRKKDDEKRNKRIRRLMHDAAMAEKNLNLREGELPDSKQEGAKKLQKAVKNAKHRK